MRLARRPYKIPGRWRKAMRTVQAAFLTVGLLPGAVFLYAAESQTPTKAQAPPKKSETLPAQSKAQAPAKSTPPAAKPRRSPARRSTWRRQTSPTPERIREIQAALAQRGHYDGAQTGKWDARTVESLKVFQSDNGLTPT